MLHLRQASHRIMENILIRDHVLFCMLYRSPTGRLWVGSPIQHSAGGKSVLILWAHFISKFVVFLLFSPPYIFIFTSVITPLSWKNLRNLVTFPCSSASAFLKKTGLYVLNIWACIKEQSDIIFLHKWKITQHFDWHFEPPGSLVRLYSFSTDLSDPEWALLFVWHHGGGSSFTEYLLLCLLALCEHQIFINSIPVFRITCVFFTHVLCPVLINDWVLLTIIILGHKLFVF